MLKRSQLAYGTFGIKAIEGAWITARQIEAARIAATRYMKEKVNYGSKYSQISQLLKNQPK
jgi:ribosomal protein L16/L10AE